MQTLLLSDLESLIGDLSNGVKREGIKEDESLVLLFPCWCSYPKTCSARFAWTVRSSTNSFSSSSSSCSLPHNSKSTEKQTPSKILEIVLDNYSEDTVTYHSDIQTKTPKIQTLFNTENKQDREKVAPRFRGQILQSILQNQDDTDRRRRSASLRK